MKPAWLLCTVTLMFLNLGTVPLFAKAADSPSFDCKKASGEIEKYICSDQELAALDQKMGLTYKAAMNGARQDVNPEEATQSLKAYQRGWIKGRNECWKATDKRRCIQENYEKRIAELQVRWGLISGDRTVSYGCKEDPKDELVATFFSAQIPAVRLERGDRMAIVILGPSGSGSRYTGAFGIVFWIKGNEAQVEWPAGKRFSCKARP